MVVDVAFTRPEALLLVPLAAAGLYVLMYRTSEAEMTSHRRLALYTTRLTVISLIAVAVAGPYVVAPDTVETGEHVHVLIDESSSMDVYEHGPEELVEGLEAAGVEVTTTPVAAGNESPLGDAVLSHVERDGELLLYSDGRVTHGTGIPEAARAASSLNARLHAVELQPTRPAAYVEVDGPGVVGDGAAATYRVSVDGVEFTEAAVDVEVDGEHVTSTELERGEVHELQHRFTGEGSHRITATADVDDVFTENDVYRKSVDVVEPPRLLYVAPAVYPYSQLLDDLYQVEYADEVPSDLSQYQAVVMQNVAAEDAGDLAALQEHVLDGNGLVVAGGPDAYERGGYEESLLGTMLPVREGGVDYDTDVVVLIDVSGSVEDEIQMNRGLAASAVDSMSDEHNVGVMAFDHAVYEISGLRPLEDERQEVQDTINRVEASGGGTDVAIGLRGARDMLDGGGNVILISDGEVWPHLRQPAIDLAGEMGEDGIRVVGVGVGEPDHVFMREVASASGGSYFPATDVDRLSVLFDEEGEREELDSITVMDRDHFITRGVETTNTVSTTHPVAARGTADLLAVSQDGLPAVSAWRYGDGRVVSVTGHRGDGVLDGLLQEPDRALATRSASWAAGDPRRTLVDVYEAGDTHVGEPTTLRYRGVTRPVAANQSFRQVDHATFEATVTPAETGWRSVGDVEYAVNYPRELGGFGVSPRLESAASVTGGGVYPVDEAEAIAEDVSTREPVTRTTRQNRDWLFLFLALGLYLTEVCLRRLEEVYGYRLAELLPQRIYRWME